MFNYTQVKLKTKQSELFPPTFTVRSLTIGEYTKYFSMELEGRFNEALLFLFKCGVVGWENITFSNPADILPALPKKIIHYLAEKTVEASNPSDEQVDKLILAVRWTDYMASLDPATRDTWDCTWCIKNKKQKSRNCPFYEEDEEDERDTENTVAKYFVNKKDTNSGVIQLAGKVYDVCPLGTIDNRTQMIINIVNMCDDMCVLPYNGGLLDQPYFWLRCYNIVKNEYNNLQDMQSKKQSDTLHGSDLISSMLKRKKSIGR